MNTFGLIFCGLLSLVPGPARSEQAIAGSSAASQDLLAGVDVVHDTKAGATYYFPQLDEWPRPDVTIYPIVAASDSGARTIVIKVVIRGTPRHLDRTFRFFVDGVPTALPLNEKGAIVEDDSGCRPSTRITVGGQDALLRRIVAATLVEIRFEERRPVRYVLTGEDLGRVRKVLALYDTRVLPSAPTEEATPPPEVTPPEFIAASKVWPKFLPGAYQPGKDRRAKVTLDASIGLDGSVDKLRVSQAAGGDCGFEEAALSAVKQWKYKPATQDGQPIEASMKIMVEFYTQSMESFPHAPANRRP